MAANTKKYFDLRQKFEAFLDSIQLEFIETDFTAEKRKERKALADADDLAFCKIYFPKIFNLAFNDMQKSMAGLSPGMYTRSGFRKCGKSAGAYTILIIKPIAQNIGGLIGINCQTLDDLAKERTAAIRRIIMRNKLLCYDYDIELIQDLKGHYIFGKTHFVAGSVNKGLRAMFDDEFVRFKRIVNDDMYDATNVTSENHCGRVLEFINSECSGQMEDDGVCMTLGNAIAEKAPIKTLSEEFPKNHFGLPALDGDNKSTWPEYMADEKAWDEYRKLKNISWDVWLGEYQDEPAVRGDIMDADWLRPVNLNLIQIVYAMSAADPARGESPAACDKGLATLGKTDKGAIICLDLYGRKEPYEQFFDYINNLRKTIPTWAMLMFENDFAQWDFAKPYYQKWCDERDSSIPILYFLAKEMFTEQYSAAKEMRPMNLVMPHQSGQILYNEAITQNKDYKKYKTEYLAYGKQTHNLNILDAFTSCWILIQRWHQVGSFKSLKTKKFWRLQSWFRK